MRRSGSPPSSRARQVDAVVLAEADVDQRDVGRELLHELLALGRRARGADDVAALAAQQQLEALPQRLVIFDEDEAQGHSGVYIGTGHENPSAGLSRKHRENSVPELQRPGAAPRSAVYGGRSWRRTPRSSSASCR